MRQALSVWWNDEGPERWGRYCGQCNPTSVQRATLFHSLGVGLTVIYATIHDIR